MTKIPKFKMADDNHFENGFITISQLRIIRYQWKLMCRCIVWFQERSIIKVSKFCKFKMADGRHWKSFFGYMSTIYCPINAKFDMKKQNYVQIQVTWPKYQNLKIQDGGRPPFWKWFHHYISAADHPISMKFGAPLHNLIPRMVTY